MSELVYLPARHPTVYLIFGYLCSGKTTFARSLEQELGAIRLTFDDFVSAATGPRPNPATFRAVHDRMLAVVDDLWWRMVANGCDVILDFGFWPRSQRDEARRIAKELGAETRLYHLWCAEDVARARCARRSAERGRVFDIAPDLFDELMVGFERLGTDEMHEFVDTTS